MKPPKERYGRQSSISRSGSSKKIVKVCKGVLIKTPLFFHHIKTSEFCSPLKIFLSQYSNFSQKLQNVNTRHKIHLRLFIRILNSILLERIIDEQYNKSFIKNEWNE